MKQGLAANALAKGKVAGDEFAELRIECGGQSVEATYRDEVGDAPRALAR